MNGVFFRLYMNLSQIYLRAQKSPSSASSLCFFKDTTKPF